MAKIALVYSTLDPVGVRVASLLRSEQFRRSSCDLAVECYANDLGVKMAGFSVDQTALEFLDRAPDPDAEAIIVLSRHESSSARPSLTVHFTGNATPEASFGGRPGELAYAASDIALALLRAYYEAALDIGLLDSYSLSYEATHHGPTGNAKPLVFIEVGSTEAEWSDERALKAMTIAVESVIQNKTPTCRPVIGLGSTHYPSNFTTLALEQGLCFGHIISKHAIRALAPGVLDQAVQKSRPGGAIGAIIDRGLPSSLKKQLAMQLSPKGLKVEEA